MTMLGTVASAQTSVGLGTAQSYAILAGAAITNTGPSTINGDIGVSPGTAITGMDEATVNGATNAANAAALQAQSDLTIAYNEAASQPPTDTANYSQIGNLEDPLTSGVYNATSSMNLTGTVTLDGQGSSDGIFIFQAGTTLVTGSDSRVELINGANPCNVFWQVGSSATLGTGTSFVGTVMTTLDISANTGATVQGRLLAQTAGAVTLDTNTINIAPCGEPTVPTTTPPTTTEPTDTTEPTTPTTTEPDDSTTPTTTEPTTSVPPTSVPTTPPTAVPNGSSAIPLLPLLLPAILIGGSVAAAPVVGPMIGQSLGDLGFPLPALPEFPPLAGSAMPGPGPVQPVAPAPMAPGPESPNGRGGEPGAMGDVTGPVTADTGGTAVLMTGSMGDFELPLPSGVRLPPLPFIR
ncbi:MAG: ice-binding family protein [Dietzia psychralcaliphila]